MKGLYSFHWDCGRMGDLTGLFVANKKAVENIIDKYVDFGEVLGKHSEVYGYIEEGDIVLETDDQDFIQKLQFHLGEETISGYNPLHYMGEEEYE